MLSKKVSEVSENGDVLSDADTFFSDTDTPQDDFKEMDEVFDDE